MMLAGQLTLDVSAAQPSAMQVALRALDGR